MYVTKTFDRLSDDAKFGIKNCYYLFIFADTFGCGSREVLFLNRFKVINFATQLIQLSTITGVYGINVKYFS